MCIEQWQNRKSYSGSTTTGEFPLWTGPCVKLAAAGSGACIKLAIFSQKMKTHTRKERERERKEEDLQPREVAVGKPPTPPMSSAQQASTGLTMGVLPTLNVAGQEYVAALAERVPVGEETTSAAALRMRVKGSAKYIFAGWILMAGLSNVVFRKARRSLYEMMANRSRAVDE